jgi:RNA polymerase sigma-70 factor, ECF subfamily
MDPSSPIGDTSDPQLVMCIARYEAHALAEAYRRHGGAVLGLARRVIRDAGAAEDITQEIFIGLWNQPERFDSARGSLRSYLLAQAHGRAVDMVRATVARRGREEREARATANAPYDIEHEVWDLALAESVNSAMSILPGGERRAIELAYFEGHTYREVAKLLGEPEGTVKSRIRSGLQRMKKVLYEGGVREVDR